MGKRVLFAEFMHETNTFSIQATGEDAFARGTLLTGDAIGAAYRGTRTAMGAAFEAAETHGWEAVCPVVAYANPAGRVTDAAFDRIAGLIVGSARELDGVLLHLHGAMSTASHDDGEGELLRRLRVAIGPTLPVVVVLDLHATVTETMARHADALVAYRTYPHVDEYDRVRQAARILARAMAGEIRPVVSLARPPVLYALDGGRTNSAPMMALLRRGDALEAAGQALVVSIQAGFSSADLHDIGPSVAVTTDGDRPAGQAIADDLAAFIWAERRHSTITFTPLPEAIAAAKAGEAADRPLVIADYADNPGAGAYGDATTLLRAMLDADLQKAALHAICDPEAAREAARAGIGRDVTLDLGGKVDPAVGGGPLRVTGRVAALTDGDMILHGPVGGGVRRSYGLSCRLRIGGIDVVVISNNGQAIDLAQFASLGIDPARRATLAVKSMQHFRAAFEPIARGVLEVDTGALCTKDFLRRGYRHVRRPIWPLDDPGA